MSPDPRPAPSIANGPTEPPLLTGTIGAALQDGVEAPARQQRDSGPFNTASHLLKRNINLSKTRGTSA